MVTKSECLTLTLSSSGKDRVGSQVNTVNLHLWWMYQTQAPFPVTWPPVWWVQHSSPGCDVEYKIRAACKSERKEEMVFKFCTLNLYSSSVCMVDTLSCGQSHILQQTILPNINSSLLLTCARVPNQRGIWWYWQCLLNITCPLHHHLLITLIRYESWLATKG